MIVHVSPGVTCSSVNHCFTGPVRLPEGQVTWLRRQNNGKKLKSLLKKRKMENGKW